MVSNHVQECNLLAEKCGKALSAPEAQSSPAPDSEQARFKGGTMHPSAAGGNRGA